MRVGLDLQALNGTPTGIGEYAWHLSDALVAEGLALTGLRNQRFDLWRFDRRLLWDQLLLPLAASRAKIDLLHCTSGTIPFAENVPIVATIHDVAWLRTQGHTSWYARAYYGGFTSMRMRTVRRLLTVSEFSRRELLDCTSLDPERVDVVPLGVAADIHAVTRSPHERPFILAVGTVEPRKNLEVVVRALRSLPGVELISVGPLTPYREKCELLAREYGVVDRVRFAGYVERDYLLALYARAAVAVVPSMYEGFGLAAAQALCAGVPLVAADAASLPEVVAKDAPLVDPRDVSGWEDALAAILGDRSAAERRAASLRVAAMQRFSWEACARATIRTYTRALE
ncbi:MAG TPA: glycosyltransferase family 1 protein [Candidatus Baltobacteraceae bacterium]|jgi:glycosyltransferase involved in cell wall biosynthesis|nr:glycosyltransferase family 1 protein [Candidatus Baltobacteraceae bacterium]